MTTRTFGKRAAAAPAPARRAPAVAPDVARPPVVAQAVAEAMPVAIERKVIAVAPAAEVSVDDELKQWTQERRQTLFYRLPWKQFSLFASISFGVASFVLPDDVNGAVDYLLWGLSLISFAIWISGSRKTTGATSTPAKPGH